MYVVCLPADGVQGVLAWLAVQRIAQALAATARAGEEQCTRPFWLMLYACCCFLHGLPAVDLAARQGFFVCGLCIAVL